MYNDTMKSIMLLLLFYATTATARPIELKQFVLYCNLTDAAICKPPQKTNYVPTLRDLEEVNRTVNLEIEYTAEQNTDIWQLPADGKGDCEDYVLLKAKRLTDIGWTSQNLRIGRLYNHAVLIATLNGVDYVLDNKITSEKLILEQIPGTKLFVLSNREIHTTPTIKEIY